MNCFTSEFYSLLSKGSFFGKWPIIAVLLLILICLYRQFFCSENSSKNTVPSLKLSTFTCIYIFLRSSLQYTRLEESLCKFLQQLNAYCIMYDRERIFKFTLVTTPIVFIYKPEAVEVIMKSNVNIDKMYLYKFFKPSFGKGLITSGGKRWYQKRKLIEAFFHKQTLKDLTPIINKHAGAFVDKLRSSQCSWVDIVPEAFTCTLAIIGEKATGISISMTKGGAYKEIARKLAHLYIYCIQRPWFYSDLFYLFSSTKKTIDAYYEILHDKTNKLIKEKLAEVNDMENLKSITPGETNKLNKRKSEIFLDFLIKLHLDDPSFSKEDIRDELTTFILAGYDTTAIAASYSLYLLGLPENRNIQIKVHEELDAIFNDDFERELTWEDVSQMQYLECVLKESLRLYPSIPIIGRDIKESFKIGDYTIEEGSACVIVPMMLHRDPDSFPDPEKFDPERFFKENVAKRHPYAYIPFSSGIRKCIGYKFALLEGKAVLANILRNSTVVSKDPRDKVNFSLSVSLMNLDPLLLKFIPR